MGVVSIGLTVTPPLPKILDQPLLYQFDHYLDDYEYPLIAWYLNKRTLQRPN
jgi:hypothetical protein